MDSNGVFPPIFSNLISWVVTDYETCYKEKHFNEVASFMDINPKNVLLYKAVLQRESGRTFPFISRLVLLLIVLILLAKLKALVMIPVDYPSSSPIFSLELNWHGKHSRENDENIRVCSLHSFEAYGLIIRLLTNRNQTNYNFLDIFNNYRKWKLKSTCIWRMYLLSRRSIY